jgi:hypothetical protein
MAQENEKEKKIIIDEGWKSEVEHDKDVEKKEEKPVEEKAAEQPKERPPLPKGDFAALISMLVTQAYFALGLLQVEGEAREPDTDMARYNIDMLETIQDKTKGNLDEKEAKVLEETLSQVRMAFVHVSEKQGK